jgi:hypothetical protein
MVESYQMTANNKSILQQMLWVHYEGGIKIQKRKGVDRRLSWASKLWEGQCYLK